MLMLELPHTYSQATVSASHPLANYWCKNIGPHATQIGVFYSLPIRCFVNAHIHRNNSNEHAGRPHAALHSLHVRHSGIKIREKKHTLWPTN